MKYLLSIIIVFFLYIDMYAQSNVTTFLGIPVDGSKKEVVKALKKKGFKKSKKDKDALQGVFNGSAVNVYVLETNGRVSRIAVLPLYGTTASEVRVQFNNLCGQFLNKDNYIAQDNDLNILTYKDISISSKEDISYEMRVNNKRYEASFVQLPVPRDSLLQENNPNILSSVKIADRNGNEVDINFILELTKYYNNSVWFMIDEQYGHFFIKLFYDNGNNRDTSEDL